MSFREITMQDVRELLRRHEAGQSARKIARELGVDARRNFERPFRVGASHPRVSDNADWTKPLARQLGGRAIRRPLDVRRASS